MRCPTLKELPPPPRGKTGWFWSEEISYLAFQKLSRQEKLFHKLKQLVLNKCHRLKRLLE